MNRGQLEELAVRLYMLAMRNRISKNRKAYALERVESEVTRWTMKYLVDYIFAQVVRLEVM